MKLNTCYTDYLFLISLQSNWYIFSSILFFLLSIFSTLILSLFETIRIISFTLQQRDLRRLSFVVEFFICFIKAEKSYIFKLYDRKFNHYICSKIDTISYRIEYLFKCCHKHIIEKVFLLRC